jgi:hypothetical protein
MTDDAENEDKPRTLPSPYKRRRAAGELELGERHKQLAELMTFGLDRLNSTLPNRLIGQPLSLDDAAAVLGLRRRNARQILASPGWQKIYAALLADVRTGAKARALREIIDLVGRVGEGKAADAKVRLDAAKTVLGEEAKGVSVNVQVNNQTNLAEAIRPGYVLDLSAMYGRREDPPTPDAEPPAGNAEPVVTDGEPE